MSHSQIKMKVIYGSSEWEDDNIHKLLVFETLYPQPGENADLGKLRVNSAEKKLNYSKTLDCTCSVILSFLDKMASSR